MAFEFTQKIRQEAFERQSRRCAFCGDHMATGRFFGHHVIPKQLGNPALARDDLLATVENCVALCTDDERNCHSHVHAGANYRTGTVAMPEAFKFSHGGSRVLHQAWQAKLSIIFNQIFDEIGERYRRSGGA
ncbi:HNH endonuclease [Methylobacterium symbioticum]|uniref:HNH endonuclease n=1 Tax=Methylobacterium symbioticum TaxID=2584084 RepID=UPI001158EF6F|nr:HNH endonuclease signature motif containing protein [Methylobacterium symbioticum]